MRVKKTKATPDLAELREELRRVKEDGEILVAKLVSHKKKMEEYYSDWEDRLNALQNKINNLETEHGIGAETLIEYDLTSELAGLQ